MNFHAPNLTSGRDGDEQTSVRPRLRQRTRRDACRPTAGGLTPAEVAVLLRSACSLVNARRLANDRRAWRCAPFVGEHHPRRRRGSLVQRTSCDGPPVTSTDCSIRNGAVTWPLPVGLLLTGVKRQRSVNRAGSERSVMRDLLWRCDEHRGPDADFPALRGLQGNRHLRIGPAPGLPGRVVLLATSRCQAPHWLRLAFVHARASAAGAARHRLCPGGSGLGERDLGQPGCCFAPDACAPAAAASP